MGGRGKEKNERGMSRPAAALCTRERAHNGGISGTNKQNKCVHMERRAVWVVGVRDVCTGSEASPTTARRECVWGRGGGQERP